MRFAIGAWAFVLGYALIYTGASWFIGGSTTGVTLASALGISSLQPQVSASAQTASQGVGNVANGVTSSTLS